MGLISISTSRHYLIGVTGWWALPRHCDDEAMPDSQPAPLPHPDPGRVRRWHHDQPKVVLVADALVTDARGRVLLVKPTYKAGWLLPGGVVEHREPPHLGAERELREETGLSRTAGALLALEWGRMFGQADLPLLVHTFDCGTASAEERLTLPQDELSDYGYFPPDEAGRLLAWYDAPRLRAAVAARESGRTAYFTVGET